MTERSGRFLVTDADEGTAVLRHLETGQVHPLSSNPGVAEDDVIEGTVEAEPPLEATWTITDLEGRDRIEIVRSGTPPTDRARAEAATLETGDVAVLPAPDGETHVIAVPADRTASVMEDIEADAGTLTRAARLGASRVELRGADGVVTVRYRRD